MNRGNVYMADLNPTRGLEQATKIGSARVDIVRLGDTATSGYKARPIPRATSAARQCPASAATATWA